MKKLLTLMFTALFALVLVGCGTNNDDGNTANKVGDEVTHDANKNEDVDNGVDHNGEARMDLAEDAADKVAELDEVDRATVIITDKNAYVAVVMNNKDDKDKTDELSKDIEDKIAEKVREVKSSLDNVYVSLNPDYVERMDEYSKRINEGEPIEGFFDEFQQSIRNVFPDSR